MLCTLGEEESSDTHDTLARMSQKKYTVEQMSAAIEAAGGVVAEAARMLGCIRRTIYTYAKEFPEVQEALDDANEVNLDDAEGTLITFVRGGTKDRPVDERAQLDALKFYLRTKGRGRGYGDRSDVDVTSGGEPIRIIDFTAHDGD